LLEIRNNCKRIAYIEVILNMMGAVQINDTSEILFNQQLDFNSDIYHRDYKVPVNRRFGLFCDWIYATFRYEKTNDIGRLQFSGKDRTQLDKVMEQLRLLEQNVSTLEENGQKLKEEMKDIGLGIIIKPVE